MVQNVELATIDLRYQGHRLRNIAGEARLLESIADRGIEEPLEGVDPPVGRFLLNGFKRLRCAQKLGIHCVPYRSLGDHTVTGIVDLVRPSLAKNLDALEQAKFVAELMTVHGMSVQEVAETLECSTGWVSMRSKLLDGMSPTMQQILFRGTFPVHCYMYTLRRFKRLKVASECSIEKFMKAVSGKKRSVRDVDLLAQAYFYGTPELRKAIDEKKLGWSLDQMKHAPDDLEGCSQFERVLLNDLETAQKTMDRIVSKCRNDLLKHRAFYAQANLLLGGLLSRFEIFEQEMKNFYDRSGNA